MYLDALVDIRCNLYMCCLRIGLIGCVDEIAHNALAVYWNPYESPAKVSFITRPCNTDVRRRNVLNHWCTHIVRF